MKESKLELINKWMKRSLFFTAIFFLTTLTLLALIFMSGDFQGLTQDAKEAEILARARNWAIPMFIILAIIDGVLIIIGVVNVRVKLKERKILRKSKKQIKRRK